MAQYTVGGLRLDRQEDGTYLARTAHNVYRLQRLPVRSRGWEARLWLASDFWTVTRYSGQTLREVARQMSEAGIRVTS